MQTFEQWMRENYSRDELRDMVNYGVSSGFQGLTYYNETTVLYRKFKSDIWKQVEEDAKEFGHKDSAQLIASLNGADNARDGDAFENLLVWYMAENTAQKILHSREDN